MRQNVIPPSRLSTSPDNPPVMSTLPVQTLKWGIFDVAYETQGRYLGPDIIALSLFWTLPEHFTQVWRFLKDVHQIAPTTILTYFATTAWLGANQAISLHMSYSVLQQIEVLASHPHVQSTDSQRQLSRTICAWMLFTLISVFVRRLKDDEELLLCGHLRAYFLPSIVSCEDLVAESRPLTSHTKAATIKTDVGFIHDKNTRRYFPSSTSFGEDGPGWNILKGLSERCQILISLFSKLYVLSAVLSQRTPHEKWILGGLSGIFVAVRLLSPSNGVSGVGYTFWATNSAFIRLHRLYSLAVDDKYRETRVKDGLGEFLAKEYHKCSSELGAVKSDIMTLACTLPPPWYWEVLRSFLFDYPILLCTLPLMCPSSPCIISILVFYQVATSDFSRTIERFQCTFNERSISQLIAQAQTLYELVDQTKESWKKGNQYYPTERKEGMRLELKNIMFQYPSTVPDAPTLKKISLTIPANSFVLLVGENGSGKTTLLKLMARLLEPISGEVLVDNHPLTSYDPLTLRNHITFLMQSEEIYPMSLRENLLMAVPNRITGVANVQGSMEEAIRMGEAERLIERVGYSAILNPPHLLGQSLQGCGNGPIGPAAVRELEKHTLHQTIPISSGERQRFLAARSFMRLLNSDTRLLMVDEPTAALDLQAERNIFEQFYRKREGKTTIFVSHRFGSLAMHADMIICMKNGEVIENGQHEELMLLGGEYARLYRAQSSVNHPFTTLETDSDYRLS